MTSLIVRDQADAVSSCAMCLHLRTAGPHIYEKPAIHLYCEVLDIPMDNYGIKLVYCTCDGFESILEKEV